MSKAQGLKAFLAALCVSAVAVDSALAQDAVDAAPAAQSETAVSPDAQDGSQAGWLLRGRTQNRIVNPFRATPAPGARALQNNQEGGTRLGPNVPPPSTEVAPVDPVTANGAACLIGFRRQGPRCVPVNIPANATLDLTGHGWMCERGYRREGPGCVAMVIPTNASLNQRGNAWVCDYGFRRDANTCAAVVAPEHASLDKAGHTWRCDQGYQQRGQICIDDATARLQQEADRAVAARPGTAAAAAKSGPGVTVNSGETRQGRTSKAKVVIGRF